MSPSKAAFKTVHFSCTTSLTSPTITTGKMSTAAAAEDPTPFLRLSVSQCHTLPTLALTLAALKQTAQRASASDVDVLLFPEAYLGGYPRGATFGAQVGKRDEWGREQFLAYWKGSVDLGDSPEGMGEGWVRRVWEREVGDGGGGGGAGSVKNGEGKGMRGDGTREVLEEVARETGVFLVVGVVERAGGTLYCAVVYVCPRSGVIGKRRKVMPTGTERLIWGQGQPSSLRAVTTTIRGVKLTLAAAICWENYMPLLRHSLYSQNVNLYLAPTADARDTWLSLMRTVACEGRCFVLSANQCVREKDLPDWIHGKTAEEDSMENERQNKRQYRKRSVFTESGNEIALPADEDNDYEEAIIGGWEETTANGKANGRKSSFVTEHGHEIILPEVGEKQRSRRSGSEGEENSKRAERARRASFITEAGHEIALPWDFRGSGSGTRSLAAGAVDEDGDDDGGGDSDGEKMAGTGQKRKESFVTADGHVIVCPAMPKSRYGGAVKGQGGKEKLRSGSQTGAAGASAFACRGGSCIVSPSGDVLAGPVWEQEDELLTADVDFDDCLRGRLDLDVAGSYSRNDAFKLSVEGLDLSPPG